jgi:hypothetical protein
MEHASGTGAGFGSAAGAALAEFAASLPPLDTAFSLPVLMVDFSVQEGRLNTFVLELAEEAK